MAENSKIEWTDHTFNPVRGCTKVSPGCLNCYAERLVCNRLKGEWGPGAERKVASEAMWKEPVKWNKAAKEAARDWSARARIHGIAAGLEPRRPRVFCASLADWLDHEWPTHARVRLLNLIEATPNLDWLLLTKRPEAWNARLLECASQSPLALRWLDCEAPNNVWVGTSVEDQTRADQRIPELLYIPARVRFLSMEPLLGPVDLRPFDPTMKCRLPVSWLLSGCSEERIDWVIVGGESGPGAREFCIDHAADIVSQCEKAGVPVFVKQLGAFPVTSNANLHDWPDDVTLEAHGEGFAAARIILKDRRKGGDMSEWPEALQVRQFPVL